MSSSITQNVIPRPTRKRAGLRCAQEPPKRNRNASPLAFCAVRWRVLAAGVVACLWLAVLAAPTHAGTFTLVDEDLSDLLLDGGATWRDNDSTPDDFEE